MSVLNVFGGPIEAPGLTSPAPAPGTVNAVDMTLTAGAAGTGNANGGNVDLVPTAGSGLGTDGEVQINSSTAGFVVVQIPYVAASVSAAFFVAARAYRVKAISLRRLTGGAAGTAQIFKAASGTAMAGGTALSGVVALNSATLNTNVDPGLSLVAGALDIATGDAIGPVFTGVMLTKVGVITVTLVPI